MGRVADFLDDALDTAIDGLANAISEIAEGIVEALMSIAGMQDDVEVFYFDVRHIALFPDADAQRNVSEVIINSVVANLDMADELRYHNSFNSLRINIRKFIQHVENEYPPGFPDLTSRILYIDYDEVADVLLGLTGEACTVESSRLNSLQIGRAHV